MTQEFQPPTTVAKRNAPSAIAPEASMPAVNTGFFDLQSFELMQRVSKAFASSTLVPKDYQNNVANCMIALNLAKRIGADPLMTMQNLVIVHGRPTWSAQFLIATVNTCGRFSALRYEFFGERNTDTWGCRAVAIEQASGEKLVGSEVTIAIAKKEGWYAKNGSKWQSIPQQMLMYRAGAWWTRAYAPELSMGLMTTDEIQDVHGGEVRNAAFTVIDSATGEVLNSPPTAAVVDEPAPTDVDQREPEDRPKPEPEPTPEKTYPTSGDEPPPDAGVLFPKAEETQQKPVRRARVAGDIG